MCAIDSSGGCDKNEELENYAYDTLKRLGGKNDLEAMVRIVNKAANLYGTYDEMLPALSNIFLGVYESNPLTILHASNADECAAIGRESCAINKAEGTYFQDTGFHEDFQDGDNQIFHFWAYLTTAASTDTSGLPANYLWGMNVAAVANVYHEIIWPEDPTGASWEDYGLSIVGIYIGMLVSMGAVPPEQLGNTIKNYVGTNSPGYPLTGMLTTVVPLPGNRTNP